MATTTTDRPRSEDLPKSLQRAKWIDSPDDKPDRKGQTLATRNPEVIRRWAEERGARPAAATRGPDGRPRVLTFDFPQGGREEGLEEISWDEWIRTFQDRDLIFVFQESTRDGRQSNFFRLVNPAREDA